MSTIKAPTVPDRHPGPSGARSIGRFFLAKVMGGLFGLHDAITAAQEARARRVVRAVLARQSHETLRAIGLIDTEVKELRRNVASDLSLWS